MNAALDIDLGLCDAFLENGDRCIGRLIVEREVDGFQEAVCSSCGDGAVRPVSQEEPQPDVAEQWWDR